MTSKSHLVWSLVIIFLVSYLKSYYSSLYSSYDSQNPRSILTIEKSRPMAEVSNIFKSQGPTVRE